MEGFELRRVDGRSPLARATMDNFFAELTERFGFDATGEGHDGPFLVLLEDGAPVAGGGVRRLPDGAAEVKRMWVDPARRGAGLGRRMLAELEALAAGLGADRVRLDTKAALVAAVALYERHGYRRIPRYNDNPHAELFFEKRLYADAVASEHAYALRAEWAGDRGTGTTGYRDYGRQVVLRAAGKPDLLASADVPFRGDADRWNPEELLLAALVECHLLSYLHVAVKNGVVVTGYTDEATGAMVVTPDDAGHFTRVDLHPRVVLADESQRALADSLHAEANRLCFIANSVRFPVHHHPVAP